MDQIIAISDWWGILYGKKGSKRRGKNNLVIYAMAFLGRDVESRKELSRNEAADYIRHLENIWKHEDSQRQI